MEEIDLQAEDVEVVEKMGYDPGDGDEEEDEDDATSSSSDNLRKVSSQRAGPMDLEDDWCPRRR